MLGLTLFQGNWSQLRNFFVIIIDSDTFRELYLSKYTSHQRWKGLPLIWLKKLESNIMLRCEAESVGG